MALTLASRDAQRLAAKNPAPAPTPAAVAPTAPGYDPSKPWTAPLDGPAPPGYSLVGNQWSKQNPELFPGDAGYQTPEGSPTPAPAPQATAAPTAEPSDDLSGWMPPSGGGGMPSGMGSPAPAPAATGQGTIQSAFQAALMKLLNGKSPQEAGMDVMNGPAVQAYNANTKRQEARDRQLIAERFANEGFGDSGALDSEILGLRARGSEAMNRYAGEQASVAEQGRRDELLQALAMAQAFGDNEAARAIQLELGKMQSDTSRYTADASAGASRYGADLNRQTNLDQLGFNYADLEQRMNQQAMEYLFNGGGV